MKPSPILRLLLLAAALLPAALSAQFQPGEEIPRFEFAATAVGLQNVPELFWLDFEFDEQGEPQREYRPLPVGIGSKGGAVEIPVEPEVRIYRDAAADDAPEPDMRPILTLPEVEEEDKLLLVFHRDPKGRPTRTFLDDSAEAHPAQTVRFANFGNSRVAAAIGDRPQLIPPGEVELLGEPVFQDGRDRYGFKFVVEETPNGRYEAPLKYLRFRAPNQRLLVLYTSFPEELADEEGEATGEVVFEPVAYRLYDRVE